jgi:LmbE family N-acetylglucosaminyl deacetylase
MKLFAPLALASILTACASAQSTFTDPANLRGERVAPRDGRELPIDQGASGLQQLLRKLNTRASLMLIVAHPDDEDGGMLTFYSRGMGARVGMLTLNRGEGGQNLMTGDFEDALGLLRTQELLAADRYFGAEQLFGTEVDFGFCKTKEEAFAKWTHERVLYDAVRAVRLYRPLVIASVFIGGVTDGHGQHQVAGEIAQEVFKAAGDPKVFPELTREGILPWQPLKVYARVPMAAITPQGLFDYATGRYTPAKFTNYVTGEVTTTTPSVDVTVHEGKIDPILGPHRAVEDFVSYVQFARHGLGLQKSQIGTKERVPPAGVFDVSYHRYGSMLPPSRQKMQEESFFDGIDTSLAGIATLAPTAFPELHASLAKIQADINVAIDHLDPTNLEKSAPMLADALKQCDSLLKEVEATRLPNEAKQNVLHEVRIKRVQLNDALAIAVGPTVDATAEQANLVQNAPATLSTSVTQLTCGSPSNLVAPTLKNSLGATQMTDLELNNICTPRGQLPIRFNMKSGFTATITQPYFYRDNIEQPVYKLREPTLRNAPETPPTLVAWANYVYMGATFTVGRIVHAGTQPVEIVPPVNLSLQSTAQVLPSGTNSMNLPIRIAAGPDVKGTLRVRTPSEWVVRPTSEPLENGDRDFFLTLPARPIKTPEKLTAEADTTAGGHYTEGYRAVGYDGIPRTNYYTTATERIVPVDLKLPAKHNIAYLPGTGDAVPEALASIGLAPNILKLTDLTAANLAQYDTVILGVRTYAAHPDLHGAPTQALLDYAKNGGNVVVQYQTGEFTAADAPFPLAVGNAAERVIDETDPVQLLVADSPLLTTPNKITPADFNDWIEERGHGFLRTWDEHYTALTETHDPGDPPQRGGLVTVQLGKGRWTYCAYAVYRQLPEAVPGAFRLFVNLINP